jgi:phage terminase small subunit
MVGELMGIIKDRTLNRVQKQLNSDFSDLALTISEMKFVGELCTRGFDYGLAHESAGYQGASKTEHQVEGRKLASKPEVAEAIQRFITTAIGPYVETLQYEAMEALRGMATWTPHDFFNPDGTVKDINDIPENKLYALDGIEDRYYGKDANKKVRVLKLTDRKQAWKMLLDLRSMVVGEKKNLNKDTEDKLQKIFGDVLSGKKKIALSERMRKLEIDELDKENENRKEEDE